MLPATALSNLAEKPGNAVKLLKLMEIPARAVVLAAPMVNAG
ncbi:MAG: hypothetical protein ACREDU_03760 [Methylocella sp.]